MKCVRAYILSIGDELTTGQSVDTNSAYLGSELARRGVEIVAHQTIPDDPVVIADAIRRAGEMTELVLVTGGLGPTPDDVTRQGLAEALGVQLVLDEKCLARIEAFFQRRNRQMAAANRIQAMIPEGAEPIENICGTAPGIAARLGAADIFVMPGVPYEMKAMFEQSVAPRLPKQTGAAVYRLVRLFGAGESDFAARLDGLLTRSGPLVVGTTVAAGLVSIRITSRGRREEDAERAAQDVIDEIRRRLGDMVVGVGEAASMQAAVGSLLRGASQTLTTAESCTGGLIAEMLTRVSGSSEYYLGGVVGYDNAVKQSQLGVSAELLTEHGAVSEQVAAAMAEGTRTQLGGDWGIGVTGIAGPTGGTNEKPVGLVYTSLSGAKDTTVEKHLLSGDRQTIRLRAALSALNTLRLRMMEGDS